MAIKSLLAKPFAAFISSRIKKDMMHGLEDQHAILAALIKTGRKTEFGREHRFEEINTPEEFREAVPLRNYEKFRTYIDRIMEGRHNVLWKGVPAYFAKTSGTSSGIKYIPITKESVDNQIDTARNALLCYISETGNNRFTDGKMIFLSGSPELERMGNIPTGRLSGIINHHIPRYLRANQYPSFETNCIGDWETKLDKIVEETLSQDMTLISGIPPWVQMYFDRLTSSTGKSVGVLFPHFDLLVHGGVNFEPYKANLLHAIGRKVDFLETFPASEGFFAFQDTRHEEGLLLNTNSGIYYEFIKANDIQDAHPTRLSLGQVEKGINYSMVISSNAGLWGYDLGDTIKFVSVNPYRILVTGRTSQFISAFGEHVICEEVEQSLKQAAETRQLRIVEFSIAPKIQTSGELPHHEWFIEFEEPPKDMEAFALDLDLLLRQKNIYYNDLIEGKILKPLVILPVRKQGFINYMKSKGRLGGQNKVPRLTNDRQVADELLNYLY